MLWKTEISTGLTQRLPLLHVCSLFEWYFVYWTEGFCHFQFSEIRDKYALAQKEIAQLNTELQDATYELQKANHRVDNLVKRLNELEDMNKRLREGNTAPGEPGESEPAQVIMGDMELI